MSSWISSAVLYQVNLRALAAREPRNAIEAAGERPPTSSPLAYVTARLPVIRRLGVNTLYLMPPYAIGQEQRKGIGSPYASRDFTQIDPEYGTTEELAALVRRAHALRMKVIFDLTPNHTSCDHVWTRSHPEFYVRNPDGSIHHDCDWSDTAKLDYTCPALRREMVAVLDHWLNFLGGPTDAPADGIDGYRLDMAHFINDRGFWNETLPELRARHPDRELLFLAECYGFGNNLDLFARSMTAAYDDDFYKICCHFYAQTEDGASRVLPSDEAARNAEFKPFWDAFQQRGLAGAMEQALSGYEQALAGSATAHWLARYTDNHDEGRGVYRFGAGAVRAVSQLIFLAPHTLPFLLTGQEFGALNRPSIHGRLHPCEKGRRVIAGNQVRWQDGVELEGNLFARGTAERTDWYAFYRELIRLRRAVSALRLGSWELLDVAEDCAAVERTVITFERRYRRNRVRCAVNLGPVARRLARADALRGAVKLYGALEGDILPAFGAVVFTDAG